MPPFALSKTISASSALDRFTLHMWDEMPSLPLPTSFHFGDADVPLPRSGY
jgi:hypothetical protein